MTRFIALLAIGSVLILSHPAQSDDTKEWCKHEPEQAVGLIKQAAEMGFPIEALDQVQTQLYLAVVYKHYIQSGEKPQLPGSIAVFVELPGSRAMVYFFKDEKFCGALTMPWAAHIHAKTEAKGE